MTTDTQLPKLKLFLAKPDRTTIGKLKHISGENLLVKSNEVSELSFTLPYYISVNNELIRNPHIDKVKEKFLIRSEFRDKIEWFTIENIDNESDDSEDLHVTCFSLGYQLQYHLVIDYEVISRNCKEATDDILKGTDWTSGYINPKFNLMYRQFDIAQGTKLSAIYEIRETFDSVVVFDTVNKTVNHYTEEELSTYKGFNIGYGKYIQNIKENIDAGEIVTRLYINGSDGLQINSVNPTGQPYIDDFSYFLYPFDMDENENIISHSEYMSDSLAKALIKYNKIVTNRKDDFGNFLSEKSDLQKKLTTEQNSLVELENELIIILDLITIAKNNGESTSELNTRKNNKNNEIKNIKNVINGLNQQIASVDSKLQDLRNVLKMETHLTPTQLNELSNFVQEDEWTDENQFDVNDLYEAGLTQMEKVNAPPINITTNIVNFLRMLSEKHNWERFDVHDIIRINHERLGIDVKTTLTEIHYDFESESIKVSISNTERDLTTEELISGAHYQIAKVDTELNKRKVDWNKTAYNFNIRNDRIEEIPVNPTNTTIKHESNDNGSVNLVLNWDYPDYNSTKKNEDNIDGFIIYMYSDKTDEPYQFTSKMSEETLIPNITHDKRAHIIPSVPSNLFYTIGIRAYRRVDEDINRDGVLMSEIIGFNQSNNVQQRMLRPMVHTVAMSDEDNPYKSYQPDVEVNINARVNGAKFVTGYDKPTNPMLNDVWIDLSNRKLWIWDGSKWGGDIEIDDIKDQITSNESHMAEFEKQLREELEKSRLEIEEAMKLVDEEMNRIENEVIPEVEKVVEETTIPKGDTIPEEIPLSGLWMDTSVQPPRLMRWDDELGDWVPLAPTENEITDMIQKAREEVQAEQQRYSRFEILKTRKSITDQINQEIGDVEQHIADLENMAENLKQRVENTEQYVEDLKATIGDDIESIGVIANELRGLVADIQESIGDFEGRITSVETIVDEVNGYIGSFVEDIERIDGQVNLNTSSIEQHSDLIASKVGSIEYEEDKTGIITNIETNNSAIEQLNNQIELRVTRDEFESATEDYDERISTAESTITAHSEAIELKAEKTELTNYVGKTEYNNKVSFLETSINGIAGRVEETEGVLDNVTGELTSVSEKYAQLIIRADGIESEVSRVEEDLDGRISSTHSLAEQNAEAITQKVSSLDYNRDKTGILSSIEQNTTDIETTAQGLLLMVTKEQYETDVEDIEERISSTEATLDIHAEAIELRAEKSELLNYVDTQTYTSQMGELTVGIEGVTTRVSSAEAIISTHTGEIETAKSQIATIDTKVDGITSTVSDLSVDLTTANQSISQIDQKADGIISTVSSIQTDLDGKASRDEAIKTVVVEYYLSTSSTTTTGGSWNVTPPDWVSGRYFWSRTKTTYSDGRVSTTDPVNITGAKGDTGARGSDGKDGRGIVSATVTYRNHTSGTAAPTSGWLSSVPSPVKGQYLWTRTVTTYTEGDPVTTYSVAYNATDGQRGADGTGISSTVVHYQIGTSGTTAPTSTWLTSPPAPIKGRYLWTRTTITYTSGSPSVSYSTSYYATDGQKGDKGDTGARGATGSTGATGQGVDSVTTQYYSSTSKTTQSGGSWVNTQPAWVKGRYLWTRTRIIYKNPTDTGYTTPVIDNAWESMTVVETKIEQLPDEINLAVTQGIGALEIGGRNLYGDFINLSSSGVNNLLRNTIEAPKGFQVTGTSGNNGYVQLDGVIQEPGTYTLSWEMRGTQSVAVGLNIGTPNGLTKRFATNNTNTFQKYIYTFKIDDFDEELNWLRFSNIQFAYFRIKNIKLEKGNKATDWTPAPEDGVDKTNVLSSINLSTEGIKIQGNKIDITGLVTVLNADGTAGTMINGGKIVGQSITANQLNINNIFGNSAVIAKIQSDSIATATLNAGRITTGTLDASKISVSNLSASSINTGTLNANNVTVTNLNASSINAGVLNVARIPVLTADKITIGSGTTFASGYNPATKATPQDVSSAIATDKVLPDTRNDNRLPSWYFSNYPRQIVSEFKARATIGAPGTTTYGTLTTTVPWSGTSGGVVSQRFESLDGTFERKGNPGATAWMAWKQLEDTASAQAKATTALTSANTYTNTQVGSVNSKINNAVTTIDGTGVTVADGSFYLKDGDMKYNVVTKRNLIRDHSFERVVRTGGNVANDGTIAVGSGGVGAGSWGLSGSPRMMTAWDSGFLLSLYGYQSAVVNSTNYLHQDVSFYVGAGRTYTISADFFLTMRSSSATPRLRVRLLRDGGGAAAQTWNQTFPILNSSNREQRHSMTFTIPNNADFSLGANSLVVDVISNNSNWIGVDGMQLVEGSSPTIYYPEDETFLNLGEPGSPTPFPQGVSIGNVSMFNNTFQNHNSAIFIGGSGVGSANMGGGHGAVRIGTDNYRGTGQASGLMYFGSDGSGQRIWSHSIYNRTYALSANMYITDQGTIGRATSARKYKTDIEPIQTEYAYNFFDNVHPVFYRPFNTADKNKEHSYYGYIADDVAPIEPRLVQFGQNGEPESFNYDRVPALLHVVLKNEVKRIDIANDKITQLEHKIQLKDSQILQLKQRIERLEDLVG